MSKHGAPDPNVQLPKAVRDIAAKADALHSQSYSKEPVAPNTPEITPVVPPVEPPAPAAPPVEPPAPPVEPQPPAPPPAAPPEQNWERSFKSMKGRYDRARDRISELEAAVESMQRTRQPEPEAPLATERLLTDQDLADYGPDLVSVIKKASKEELNPLLAQLLDRLNKVEGAVGATQQRVQQTGVHAMLSDLDRLVPDWRAINVDQNFLDWLALPDLYSGVIRHELLGQAYRNNDAATVSVFFKGFLSEAASDPAGSTGLTPPANTPPAPQLSLDNLAAPGRAKSTAAPAPVEKPVISRADISLFYANKNAGKYSPELAAQYEAQIWEAQREGRIRN